MKKILAIYTYLYALLSIVPFLRPKYRPAGILLWVPKLFAGALSPVISLVCGLGAVLGLTHRDWKLTGAGLLGIGLAAKFINDIPNSQSQFEAAFGPDWQGRVSVSPRSQLLSRPSPLLTETPGDVGFQRDLVIGQSTKTGKPLLADLWLPPTDTPCSGLGLIYAHGSGWRVGDKDLGTRYFFRRLAGHGHVVLDLAYTLWPQADIPGMVTEIYQAVLWMKENSAVYGVNPKRIVLMGGSAGGHLALTAAYAPNHPAFLPSADAGDTTVRGVVAFYPPVDFQALHTEIKELISINPSPVHKAALNLMARIFTLRPEDLEWGSSAEFETYNFAAEMIGGDLEDHPELFQLLSPINHMGPHCPPTLLLQGSDDSLVLASSVHRLYQDLKAADVPAILVEFPHTEHAFDLLLPQISPVAQAATKNVERFLAQLV
ncbi:alpha/beta hydrolase [Chloroflexota bacterium]